MQLSDFYVGMPVVMIEDHPETAGISGDSNPYLTNGMTGTVHVIDESDERHPIGVNWNGVDPGEGYLHTLGGNLEDSTGWWCGIDQLTLYDPDFQIGDRVIAIQDYDDDDDDSEVKKGDTGTVCDTESGNVAVRWDRPSSSKHDCNGRCERGHGWFVEPTMIIKIRDSQEIEESEFDLAELLKGGDLFG